MRNWMVATDINGEWLRRGSMVRRRSQNDRKHHHMWGGQMCGRVHSWQKEEASICSRA